MVLPPQPPRAQPILEQRNDSRACDRGFDGKIGCIADLDDQRSARFDADDALSALKVTSLPMAILMPNDPWATCRSAVSQYPIDHRHAENFAGLPRRRETALDV